MIYMVDVTSVITNYATWVYGTELMAGLAFMIIVTMIGIRFGWGFESFVVVLTPTILLLMDSLVGSGLSPLFLIGIGLIIGFGLLAMIRR